MFKISMVVLAVMLGLVGCAKNSRMAKNGDENRGVDDSMRFYGSDNSQEGGSGMAKNTYYFGYDSYDLAEEDINALSQHANQIAANQNAHVRIEGHTDERGSREYNIALGERRAKAVTHVLKLKGVPDNKISIVSYGKEKPANVGHDESAWSLNRRSTVVYEGS